MRLSLIILSVMFTSLAIGQVPTDEAYAKLNAHHVEATTKPALSEIDQLKADNVKLVAEVDSLRQQLAKAKAQVARLEKAAPPDASVAIKQAMREGRPMIGMTLEEATKALSKPWRGPGDPISETADGAVYEWYIQGVGVPDVHIDLTFVDGKCVRINRPDMPDGTIIK